jgi:DNA repair exonuclease SbcCD ATPase subunit
VTDVNTATPSVGGILLAQGLVNEEQLHEAEVAQERTGKPVGQILVEWGAITRLELASALAEQWSYAGATPLRRPGEPRPEEVEAVLTEAQAEYHAAEQVQAAQPDADTLARIDAVETTLRELRDRDDDATITQFREAIVDLARRVGASEPLLAELSTKAEKAVASEQKLTEVALAVDASLARLGAVEAGVADATAKVEERSGEIGRKLDELERRLDVGAGELTELAQRIERAADHASLEQIRTRLDELAARPPVVPELEEAVQRLTARIDIAPDAAAFTELRGAVDALVARSAAADDLAVRVDELAQLVQQLPAGAGGAGGSDVSQAAAIELRSRIDQLSHRADEAIAAATAAQASGLDELRATVAELAARPDPAAAFSERIEQLASRVAEVAARDDGPALAELRAAVSELAARPAADPGQAARLDDLAARLDDLTGRLAGAATETRVDAGEAAVEELRRAVTELTSRPAVDPELAGRVDAIAARMDVLADVVKDHPEVAADDAAIDDVRRMLAGAEATAAKRLEELSERLAQVERAGSTQGSLADSGAVTEQIERAAASWAATQETLVARVDQLELRLREAAASAADLSSAPHSTAVERGTPVPGISTGAGLEQEFDRLLMAIERLSLRIGEHDRALSELMRGGASAQRVAELAGRIAELELRGGGAVVAGEGGGEAIGGGALLAVAGRLEEVENARKADREKLFTQIERMASALDWRLQRLEAAGAQANGSPTPS